MPKNVCLKCGSPMKKGWCVDETCPFSDSIRKRDFLLDHRSLPLFVPGFNPPIPNMKDSKVRAAVKAHVAKQKANALIRELRKRVKELQKDKAKKHAEIEAWKKRYHARAKQANLYKML